MSPDHASIPTVVRMARAAAAADARRRFITASGYALAGAMGTAAVGVSIASLLTDAPWWWVVPLGAGAASIAISGGLAWARRWSLNHAAGEIDRANSTEGALRTAIEIRDGDGEPSLVALARRRGERVAMSVDPRRGIAPPDHRGWWWSVPGIGACVAFGLLLDPIDRTPNRPDPSPMIARALDQTAPGLEAARAVEPESLPDPEKWAQTVAEIEALEEELRRGDAAEDAAIRAAAAMEQAADELERQAELAAREEQAIRDRAEAYRTDEASDQSPLARRLADALARNDMDAAEQAARAIDRASESLSEDELRALADALEDLASRLEDPEPTPPEQAERASDLPETPPPTLDPADQPETSPPHQTPEVAPPPQEPQSRQRQNPESLPEALRRQAESLRKPSQAPESLDPSQQDANRDQTQQPNEQPQGSQPGEISGEQTGEPASGDPNQRQPEPQPPQNTNQQGQPQLSQQNESQQGQPEQGQPQQGNEQDAQQQPSEQPAQQPTQQPAQQGQPRTGEQPVGHPGDQPEQQPGQQPGQQPEQVPTPDPGGQPQETPQPDPNAPPGSIEQAIERLCEQQDARQRNRQVAESLRERARGLMDDPSLPPGDGGAGREDAPLAQDNPLTDDPSRYEPVDVSGQTPQDPDSGRVVGEWFDPNREDLPPSERAAAAGEMRRAVRKARDAVDNQQVPRRYRDLVRRVFDRVERRAEEVAPGPAPQGQDAQP
ncbi:MAG: hypothetical protein D6692_10675 [Planctomycetota bacterium]|nr:MAG: hypothetical protein D6692_10675 [Planctomycetota bacterium]